MHSQMSVAQIAKPPVMDETSGFALAPIRTVFLDGIVRVVATGQ
jgi:hypothetical protein